MMPFTAPEYKKPLFNCPLCNAYSSQLWYNAIPGFGSGIPYNEKLSQEVKKKEVSYCFCLQCSEFTIWINKEMKYPKVSIGPLPNTDMPGKVKLTYDEARNIASDSARSACALLRVALEDLLDIVNGENKNSLNENIRVIVEANRLPREIQQSMDTLRITGDAVLHPGRIDLKNVDKKETAIAMFNLLNAVTKALISDPNYYKEYYENIPQSQKDAIEKRDRQGPTQAN